MSKYKLYLSEEELKKLNPSKKYMTIKYFLDAFLIFITLPITLPITVIVAILIKLDDGGSIFYTQKRVGYLDKEFKVYKFRSMKLDSEKDGAKFASNSDDRITKIGKFIRKNRIDEIPQFLNVLKGEMSLIGPRPEQKVFVDKFSQEIPFYNLRHLVKPGISGWAQVIHGYASDMEETKVKLEYDLYYIQNFSFKLDLIVFFKTIKTVLTGFGAR